MQSLNKKHKPKHYSKPKWKKVLYAETNETVYELQVVNLKEKNNFGYGYRSKTGITKVGTIRQCQFYFLIKSRIKKEITHGKWK